MQKEEGDNEREDGSESKVSSEDEELMYEEKQSMHMRGLGDRKPPGAIRHTFHSIPPRWRGENPLQGIHEFLKGGVKVRIKRKFGVELIGWVLCGISSRVYTNAVGGMVLGMRGRCMKRAS